MALPLRNFTALNPGYDGSMKGMMGLQGLASKARGRYIETMTAHALKAALQRVEHWPEHAQDMLAELALEIDEELRQDSHTATPAELAGIDRGLKAAEEGRFATDEQVEAVIAKYRPA